MLAQILPQVVSGIAGGTNASTGQQPATASAALDPNLQGTSSNNATPEKTSLLSKIGGIATGALTGGLMGGPAGALLGGGAGILGNILGLKKSKKEQKKKFMKKLIILSLGILTGCSNKSADLILAKLNSMENANKKCRLILQI